MTRIALILIAPLLLAGCGGTPTPQPAATVYPLSMTDAVARLGKADTASFIRAERCALPIDITSAREGSDAVRWQVTSSFFTIASFTVRVQAQGATGTTAAIEVPTDPAGGEMYDGGKRYDHQGLRQPLRPAIQELLDAALTSRAFDPSHIAAASDAFCPGGAATPAPATPAPGGNGQPGLTAVQPPPTAPTSTPDPNTDSGPPQVVAPNTPYRDR